MNDGTANTPYERDPRIASLAQSEAAAWLWAADGSRILWCNRAGAAAFGATSSAALADYRFDAGNVARTNVLRIAPTLARSGAPRLERLRGFGGLLGGLTLCACSHVTVADNSATLIVAQHAGQPVVPLRSPRAHPATPEASDETSVADAGSATQWAPAIAAPLIAAPEKPADLSHAREEYPAPTETDAEPLPLPPETPPLHIEGPLPERRHPLRFVWQMDADGRFSVGSDEFTEVIGPRVATSLGRNWRDVAADLALDPEHQVERAVATRDTWSGITVSWPVEGSGERLKVELSGLPSFDRNRTFLGYRGFGVCRDVDRITTLSLMRRTKPATGAKATVAGDETLLEPDLFEPVDGPAPSPPPEPVAEPQSAAEQPPVTEPQPAKAQNVVPFRVMAAETKAAESSPAPAAPALSAGERSAFHELARRLAARLNGAGDEDGATANRGRKTEAATVEAPPDKAVRAVAVVEDASPATISPAAISAAALAPAGISAAAISAAAKPSARNDGPQSGPPETAILDHLPIGLLVYRFDHLQFANKNFLAWTGHTDLESLREAGGLDSLLVTPRTYGDGVIDSSSFTISGHDGKPLPFDVRMVETMWRGDGAHALILSQHSEEKADVSGLDAARAETAQARDALADRQTALHAAQTALTKSEDARKSAEDALAAANKEAAAVAKTHGDMLQRLARRIGAPLAAIAESAAAIETQQFGPLGHDRYRAYLADIRASGAHATSLIDNLSRLADIEAGRTALSFVDVHLNDLVQHCVAALQTKATSDRVIMRMSLAPALRPVVADASAIREVLHTLVEHALRMTGPGGQVIISTSQHHTGDVVLHVRDTGIGMTEGDLRAALDPFHVDGGPTAWDARSATLALPLAKALVEANHATFAASSTPKVGTLIEIAFPAKRVLER